MKRTPAFITINSKEIRDHLERLEYKKSQTFHDEDPYIWTTSIGYYYSTNNPYLKTIPFGEEYLPYGICCKDDIWLFYAITSLRDDTDKGQWYTDGNGNWEKIDNSDLPSRYMQMEGHKATIEELIENERSKY